jgi:hypothetical protein
MRQADGRVWLDIVNDGVQTNRAQPGGSGIQNLSARIAALHGCSSQELERTAGIGCTHGRRSTTAAND